MGNNNKYEGLDTYAVRLIRHKARQLVGRAGFVEADRHDLEQDMMVDLLRRMPRFDPQLSKRETFITRIVEHHVATIVESQKAGVRDYRIRAGSLDEQRTDDEGHALEGPPVLSQNEYIRETVASARRDSDHRDLRVDLKGVVDDLPVDLRVLCERLKTSSVSEISEETGTPRGTVYEAIKRLRARFEKAGLAAYLEGPDTFRKPPVGTP